MWQKKNTRTFHRYLTQTLRGTVTALAGLFSTIISTRGPSCGWHSCVRSVRLCPVMCFAFMNGTACDGLLSVSACRCLLRGCRFFFFFSMSSLSFHWGLFPVWCFCVHPGINTPWTNHRGSHTPHLASGRKKRVLLYHHIPLALSSVYFYCSSVWM